MLNSMTFFFFFFLYFSTVALYSPGFDLWETVFASWHRTKSLNFNYKRRQKKKKIKAFTCWLGVSLVLESQSNKPFEGFLLSAHRCDSDGGLVRWHFFAHVVFNRHPALLETVALIVSGLLFIEYLFPFFFERLCSEWLLHLTFSIAVSTCLVKRSDRATWNLMTKKNKKTLACNMSLLERLMSIDVKFWSVVRLARTIADYHALTCLSPAIRLMYTLGWYHPSKTFFIFCMFSGKKKNKKHSRFQRELEVSLWVGLRLVNAY